MRTIFWIVLACSGLVSCITTRVGDSRHSQAGNVEEHETVHWLGFGESIVKSSCHHGIQSIDQGATFGQIALRTITVGIYCPETIRITCAK